MARRRRSRDVLERSRDALSIAIEAPPMRPLVPIMPGPVLSFEDRRLHHPLGGLAPPAAVPRSSRRLVDRPVGGLGRSVHRFVNPLSVGKIVMGAVVDRIGFARPSRVAICVRRKVRREVLMAKGRGGRNRRGRRNEWSDVSCR